VEGDREVLGLLRHLDDHVVARLDVGGVVGDDLRVFANACVHVQAFRGRGITAFPSGGTRGEPAVPQSWGADDTTGLTPRLVQSDMSRLAFRAAAAVVGVALLAVYLAAAAFVADALLFLWATRPDLPVLLALLAVVAVGSAYLSYWIGTAQVLASLEGDRLPASARPTSTIGSTHSRLGWLSTARRCTSPTPGRRTRSRSAADRAAGPS